MSSSDQTLRVGIAGTGKIAGVTSRAIRESPNATLAAVSSRRLDSAERFSEEHGAEHAFGSWRQMCESNVIDAVYIATPTAACEEIAVAAASCGQHVLAEKPFVDLPTLLRIVDACREHGVAFLDATHFVHHPRTARLKVSIRESLGQPLALRSSFFAPVKNRSNIRFNPSLEPTGVVGDLAWYCFRATAEFLDAGTSPVRVETEVRRDPDSGAVYRATGLFSFDDGTTSSWDAGFDVGAFVQDLDLLGSDATIHLDDFVHDWFGSYDFGGPSADPSEIPAAGFSVKRGKVRPRQFERIETPCETPHQVLMFDRFAALAKSENLADDNAPWIRASIRTQELLDAAWMAAR